MNDFMEAYLESNYSPIADSDTSSLHSSCMRYEDKARNAADFYTNFAGAKILVARDESNNILGRAVVWNEVTLWKSINTPIAASLLDRIYPHTHRHRTDPQAGAGGRYPVATQIQRLYTYNGFHRTESH